MVPSLQVRTGHDIIDKITHNVIGPTPKKRTHYRMLFFQVAIQPVESIYVSITCFTKNDAKKRRYPKTIM